MRTLIFLLLSFSFTVHAEDEFETKFKALHKTFEKNKMDSRVKTKFDKFPNDNYIEEFSKVHAAHIEKELALHAEYCKNDSKRCLSEKEAAERKAQYRIVFGLEQRLNEWSKEKDITPEKLKEKQKAFNRCHDEKKDCDQISNEDRKIASEDPSEWKISAEAQAAATASNTVTTPIEDPIAANKKAEAAAAAKAKSTSAVVKPVVVSKSEDKVKADPKPNTEEVDPLILLTQEGKEDVVAKPAVEAEPKKEPAADKTKEPKKTDKEIVADKKLADPEVIEVNDDEKTPRNYKPESCKWATDLPRKVVNGPGCGPKGRSKICTGYVICEQKNGDAKFVRMSTCAEDKCGDDDAVSCTKDMGYFSMRPVGEKKLFMTPKLKKALSGATEQ